jgi:hemerythrin HHE cation binding domain-containing protein
MAIVYLMSDGTVEPAPGAVIQVRLPSHQHDPPHCGRGDPMSLRTLMQAGPAKANELFAKLSETSDGAIKTREKFFSELKAELELHTSLEEQHLFPILRRNAETKDLVAEGIKDNKELRAKLTELEALPKNDETFPEQLKDLQKTFRQHARDDKRELLPAVQRALSEEQVQNVVEKIEAGVAEADKARQDEVEARRLKARQEREEAERQAEQQAAAERAQNAAAEQARQEEAEQKRARLQRERKEAEHRAEQQAAAKRAEADAQRRAHEAAEAVARTATAAQTNLPRIAEHAAANAQRVGAEVQNAANIYLEAMKTMVPDLRTVAALPEAAVGAMEEIRSAWIEWMSQTALTGTQISQDLLRQAAEQQRRFAAEAVQGWMEQNARVMQISIRMAQESLRPFATRFVAGSDHRRTGR